MVVQHNLGAMNSNRMLNITVKSQASSTEKLSSGYRINRAADDAAGLSISEKMRKQIRGLTQAATNAQDGISMVQVCDGALTEVHDMLQRANELSVKAANGTLSSDDREYIQNEISQIHKEIDRVKETTKFNETYLFPTTKEDGVAHPSVAYGDELGNANVLSSKIISVEIDTANKTYAITTDENVTKTSPDGTISDATTLEERIANEFLPNAVSQIYDAFPSLNNGDIVKMDIQIDATDAASGEGGTLAYVQVKTRDGSGNVREIKLWVDPQDFDDSDATGEGASAGVLESTIAHEMMHAVMQSRWDLAFGDSASLHKLWFTEGTAQLSGGGFTTGWNDWLYYEVLNNPGVTDKDAAIADKLKNGTDASSGTYHVADRQYGTGYLAVAYISHLIDQNNGGSGAITSEALANGANLWFAKINELYDNSLAGGTFSTAKNTFLEDSVLALTGKNLADIIDAIDQDDSANATDKAAAVSFIKDFATAVNGGAGSLITPTLQTNGTDILANTAGEQNFKALAKYNASLPIGGTLNLHVGADATSNNQIKVNLYDISAKGLGINRASVTTADKARDAINRYAEAIQRVSTVRSYFGAIQNRLEHTINNLDNVVENTTAAESAIRDTDMATEMVKFSNNNILAQAGQSMLAQANQSNQGVLSILG